MSRDFPETERRKVWARQEGKCVLCGSHVDIDSEAFNGGHAHHRKLRSQGGTWALSNVVALHGWCHDVQPGSVHQNPEDAFSVGLMIRSHTYTPAQLPIFDAGADAWFLLDDEGGSDEIAEIDALRVLVASGNLRGAE